MRAGPWTGRYSLGGGAICGGTCEGAGPGRGGAYGAGSREDWDLLGAGPWEERDLQKGGGAGSWPPRSWEALSTGPECLVYGAGTGSPVDGMGAALPRDKGRRRRETDLEGADLEGRGPPDRGGTSATRETWRVLIWPWTPCAVGPYPLPHRVLSRAHTAPRGPGRCVETSSAPRVSRTPPPPLDCLPRP